MESATLDLPTIDASALDTAAPPAPKTQVATAASAATEIDLTKIDLEAVALAKFGDWKERAADVNKRHGGVIFENVQSPKGFAALRAALAETKQVRFDGQNVSKALKSKLANTSKAIGAREAEIALAVEKTEADLQKQVDDEEARKAEAKRVEEAKVQARRDEFDGRIAVIRGYLASAKDLPSERIAKGIAYLGGMVIGEEWAEFQADAERARTETRDSLQSLHDRTKAAEDASAAREAQRLETERVAAAQRVEAARLKAEADAIAAERAELTRQREEIAAAHRVAAAAQVAAPAPEPQPAITSLAGPNNGNPKILAGASTSAQQAMVEQSRERFLASESAKAQDMAAVSYVAAPSTLFANLCLRAPEVVGVDPGEEGGDQAIYTTNIDVSALLAHIAKAFDTKFPSQPKPSIEWWAELRSLVDEVAA
jgi:hypothetical protein